MSDRAAAGREAAVADRRADSPAASAELTRRIAAIVDDKKGADIIALDVRELVGYTDYLLIATARNERQAKAIQDEVHLRMKKDEGEAAGAHRGGGRGTAGCWLTTSTASCT